LSEIKINKMLTVEEVENGYLIRKRRKDGQLETFVYNSYADLEKAAKTYFQIENWEVKKEDDKKTVES